MELTTKWLIIAITTQFIMIHAHLYLLARLQKAADHNVSEMRKIFDSYTKCIVNLFERTEKLENNR